jgi:hypothetical protein
VIFYGMDALSSCMILELCLGVSNLFEPCVFLVLERHNASVVWMPQAMSFGYETLMSLYPPKAWFETMPKCTTSVEYINFVSNSHVLGIGHLLG